jgi:hypothetical protein
VGHVRHFSAAAHSPPPAVVGAAVLEGMTQGAMAAVHCGRVDRMLGTQQLAAPPGRFAHPSAPHVPLHTSFGQQALGGCGSGDGHIK